MNVISKLQSDGVEFTRKEGDYVTFYLRSSKIFGRLALGKYLITIEKLDKYEYSFVVQFVTQKSVYNLITILLSLMILVNVVATGETYKVLAIPAISIFGHIVFLGILSPKIQRIKRFFLRLDE